MRPLHLDGSFIRGVPLERIIAEARRKGKGKKPEAQRGGRPPSREFLKATPIRSMMSSGPASVTPTTMSAKPRRPAWRRLWLRPAAKPSSTSTRSKSRIRTTSSTLSLISAGWSDYRGSSTCQTGGQAHCHLHESIHRWVSAVTGTPQEMSRHDQAPRGFLRWLPVHER